MRLAGIDGCKGGWVAVVAGVDDTPACAVARFSPTLDALFQAEGPDFAVIDMPVGFVSGPVPRDVEPALRARLPGKAASVFSTPCRQALAQPDYAAACAVNAQHLGRKLSRQIFGIFPKMREVDAALPRIGQHRLREGHPEVSFALMAGQPVRSPKRKPEGRAARLALLSDAGFRPEALLAARQDRLCQPDDLLDAAALLWSARRYARGEHQTLPPTPQRDSAGLEMSVIA